MKIRTENQKMPRLSDIEYGKLYNLNGRLFMKGKVSSCANLCAIDMETGIIYDDIGEENPIVRPELNAELFIGPRTVELEPADNICIKGPSFNNITWQGVDSSMIDQIGYLKKSRIFLYVKFDSGKVYQYTDVPDGLFMDFVMSLSKGEFYNRKIKGQYKSREVK